MGNSYYSLYIPLLELELTLNPLTATQVTKKTIGQEITSGSGAGWQLHLPRGLGFGVEYGS